MGGSLRDRGRWALWRLGVEELRLRNRRHRDLKRAGGFGAIGNQGLGMGRVRSRLEMASRLCATSMRCEVSKGSGSCILRGSAGSTGAARNRF